MKRQTLISSLAAGAGLILLGGCAYDDYDRGDYGGSGGGVYYEQNYPSYGYYGPGFGYYGGGYGYRRDHRDGGQNWSRNRDHDGDRRDGDHRGDNRGSWRNQSQNSQAPQNTPAPQQQSGSSWRNGGGGQNSGGSGFHSDGGSRGGDRGGDRSNNAPSGGPSGRFGHPGTSNNPL